MRLKNIFPFIFQRDNLYIVKYKGERYVAMKHVVEGMGLSWGAQHLRLKRRFSGEIMKIEVPLEGVPQEMVCLSLRKLPRWLMSINPDKVKHEIRDRVIKYRQVCDETLYANWTNDIDVNSKTKASEWIMLFEQYHKVLNKISRQRQYNIRKVLYEDLKSLANLLERDVPDMTEIVGKTPVIGDPCIDSDDLYEFWDIFEMFENPNSPKLNHSSEPGIIAIDPYGFREYCQKHELAFPSLDTVRREMRTRSRYPFEGCREINSAVTGKPLRCWIFRSQ